MITIKNLKDALSHFPDTARLELNGRYIMVPHDEGRDGFIQINNTNATATVVMDGHDGWRDRLYTTPMAQLSHYLVEHPEVAHHIATEVLICLYADPDNDDNVIPEDECDLSGADFLDHMTTETSRSGLGTLIESLQEEAEQERDELEAAEVLTPEETFVRNKFLKVYYGRERGLIDLATGRILATLNSGDLNVPDGTPSVALAAGEMRDLYGYEHRWDDVVEHLQRHYDWGNKVLPDGTFD